MRTVSDNLIKFVAAWEKFTPTAYKATANEKYYTIGYGHYGADVAASDRIDEPAAVELLRADLNRFAVVVDKCAAPSFTQSQFDAIVDLTYNAGTRWIEPDSVSGDLDDYVRTGDVEATRRIMATFIYQGGVALLGLKRRTVGRLALFDGAGWREAEEKGRMLIR